MEWIGASKGKQAENGLSQVSHSAQLTHAIIAPAFTAQPATIEVPRCPDMYSESARVLIQAMCPST